MASSSTANITASFGGGLRQLSQPTARFFLTFLSISHLWYHLVAIKTGQSTWIQVTNNSVFHLYLEAFSQFSNFLPFAGEDEDEKRLVGLRLAAPQAKMRESSLSVPPPSIHLSTLTHSCTCAHADRRINESAHLSHSAHNVHQTSPRSTMTDRSEQRRPPLR